MRLTGIVIAALASLLFHSEGWSFGTLNFLGQSAEHERITALALAPFQIDPWTLSEIKGRGYVFGAIGAPDRPDRGLLFVPAAHCDGGDSFVEQSYPQSREAAATILKSCQQWIFLHLHSAIEIAGQLVDSAGNGAHSVSTANEACAFSGAREGTKCAVLGELGLALHAAQDFYAHTNWTDSVGQPPYTVNNPRGLGNEHRAAWIDPRQDVIMPEGLISGCFSGAPEWIFCSGRIRHAVLNKDTGPIDVTSGHIGIGTTPRGQKDGNFARAVRAAIEDTRDKWAYFEESIVASYGAERASTIICIVRKDEIDACINGTKSR